MKSNRDFIYAGKFKDKRAPTSPPHSLGSRLWPWLEKVPPRRASKTGTARSAAQLRNQNWRRLSVTERRSWVGVPVMLGEHNHSTLFLSKRNNNHDHYCLYITGSETIFYCLRFWPLPLPPCCYAHSATFSVLGRLCNISAIRKQNVGLCTNPVQF